jgi:hypothetical protein
LVEDGERVGVARHTAEKTQTKVKHTTQIASAFCRTLPIIGVCRAPTNHRNPRGTIISCQFGASLCHRGVFE